MLLLEISKMKPNPSLLICVHSSFLFAINTKPAPGVNLNTGDGTIPLDTNPGPLPLEYYTTEIAKFNYENNLRVQFNDRLLHAAAYENAILVYEHQCFKLAMMDVTDLTLEELQARIKKLNFQDSKRQSAIKEYHTKKKKWPFLQLEVPDEIYRFK